MSIRKQRGEREEGGKQVKQKVIAKSGRDRERVKN